jgi:hypothetical protein
MLLWAENNCRGELGGSALPGGRTFPWDPRVLGQSIAGWGNGDWHLALDGRVCEATSTSLRSGHRRVSRTTSAGVIAPIMEGTSW